MELSTIDVNKKYCTGKVVRFRKNTFIIENKTEYGIERYLISKRKFKIEGYTFLLCDLKKDLNNYTSL
ncbi:hypothetical protein ACNG37_002427 [Enterococcus hirae]